MNPKNIFSPWTDDVRFATAFKRVSGQIVSNESKVWALWSIANKVLSNQIEGEFWECGVFMGGSASMLAECVRSSQRTLRLFDTFKGIPVKDEIDLHNIGDFSNTSVDRVRNAVNYEHAVIHEGIIPDTFVGREGDKIAFCHVDVDMYRSVKDCCEFIWPRLSVGGAIVFDDYAVTSCPGARYAADEFIAKNRSYIVQSWGGNAVAFKPPQEGEVVVRPPEGWGIEFKSPGVREKRFGKLKISWGR